MAKQHLKRLAMPKSWPIERKGITFVTRPKPGTHSFAQGMPISLVFRDVLKLAENIREVRYILQKTEVKVDGKRRKDEHFLLGLMDVLEFPGKAYRMLISTKGKLVLVEEKHPQEKPCKVVGKRLVKGKVQIALHDGTTLLTDKPMKVGDSIVLKQRQISEVLPFKEGSKVFLTGGKHVGETGTIEHLSGRQIVCKTAEASFETDRCYAFVIPPTITIP
ncbi:MAG: S4 domain-containing protein [Nanoarchaeota archaeon]